MNDSSKPLRLGTRASALARWQANWTAAQLTEHGVSVELVPITTQGDVQMQPIERLAGQGVFTKELQQALLARRIDFAVHSLKDLTTERVEDLCLAAVPERASARDVLVSRHFNSWSALPSGARVGTGSVRRRAQLLHLRSDLEMVDVRGNVDTRLKKLDDGQYDAIVLAEAGLTRLGLEERITQRLSLDEMVPAVGQGALGIECRRNDARVLDAVSTLNHAATMQQVVSERALLTRLRGGCLAPIGALAVQLDDARLSITAVVLSADGRQRLRSQATAATAAAEQLGVQVADELLDQGAAQLISGERP